MQPGEDSISRSSVPYLGAEVSISVTPPKISISSILGLYFRRCVVAILDAAVSLRSKHATPRLVFLIDTDRYLYA